MKFFIFFFLKGEEYYVYKVLEMGWSLCQQLKCFNPYICATWWYTPLIIQIKYPRSRTLGCKVKGIRKSKFVAKTENFFLMLRFPSNKNFCKKMRKFSIVFRKLLFFAKFDIHYFFRVFFNKMRNFLQKIIREKCQSFAI